MNIKKKIKPFIFSGLYHIKFFKILKAYYKNKVVILMYHRFSGGHEPFKVKQSIFENQIKFLINNKYNFISLKHYSEFISGERLDCPENPVIITIDDGYKDNYDYAYPVLKKYSIPATIFLTTDFINNGCWLWFNKLKFILRNTTKSRFKIDIDKKPETFYLDSFIKRHDAQLTIFNYCKTINSEEIEKLLTYLADELNVDVPEVSNNDFKALSWENIYEMQKYQIEFGSHTCTHPILSMLTSDELYREIHTSKEELEIKLGTNIVSFCYPVGKENDINDMVVREVQNAGYTCAVTTTPGANKIINKENFLLKRLSVNTDDKVKLSRILTNL